jgi:alpha-1,3-mannosyltransferase
LASLQALLGLPFLAVFPASYLARAFELTRVFFHTWTVNLKFLPPDVFTSPRVAAALLAAHLAVLVLLAAFKWCSPAEGGVVGVVTTVLAHAGLLPPLKPAATVGEECGAAAAASTARTRRSRGASSSRSSSRGDTPPRARRRNPAQPPPPAPKHEEASQDHDAQHPHARHVAGADSGGSSKTSSDSSGGAFTDGPGYIAWVLLSSNFVGIAFARTLHYQFYAWYFHALPLLLWAGDVAGDEAATARSSWWRRWGRPGLRLAALAGVEYAFNVGDAAGAGTPLSAAVLQVAHAVVLASVCMGAAVPPSHGAGPGAS